MLRHGGVCALSHAPAALLRASCSRLAAPPPRAKSSASQARTKPSKQVEVLLREPVQGLGAAGEVRAVRRGRARNALVPHQQAVYAKPAVVSQLGLDESAIEQGRNAAATASKRELSERDRMLALRRDLLESPLVFRTKVNKHTQAMAEPITPRHIARRILEQKKIHVPESAVHLPDDTTSLATLGRHTVYLNVVSGLQSESEGEQRDAVFPPYPQLIVDIKKKR